MNIVSCFLYYILFASSILIYGIGLNQTVEIGNSKFENFTSILKVLLSIYSTSILAYLITTKILIPIGLLELFPLICLLLYITINSFLEALIRITTGTSSSEFIISWLIIIISVTESTSFINSLIICTSCLIAFAFVTPFVYAFRKRIYVEERLKERHYSLIMFFLFILLLAISAFDIGWMNPGVLK